MELLERQSHLETLQRALAEARAGTGKLCLVTGEAGIGKTSLVEAFTTVLKQSGNGTRVLWGACDALFTPRPMGPLFDFAAQSVQLRSIMDAVGPEREQLFRSILKVLTDAPGATVVVFEDAHWADEATLDLLKFLGRRIRQVRALIVVTYRDDELGREHPLWQLLGDVPRASLYRVALPPLSETAVALLARRAGRDATGLHGLTHGNPFFVTEVLANDDAGVPTSVRAAVFARAARLSADARQLLDVISVVPGRAERWLVSDQHHAEAVEECMASGMLESRADHIWFRHELARHAWEDGLEHSRRRELHARVLRALLARGYESGARLVHHASASGDGEQVLRLAPAAAADAARLGAHREAAAILTTILPHTTLLPPPERAALLDRLAFECNLSARVPDAIAAQEQALALWRELGEHKREGAALRFLSRLHWYRGDGERVRCYALEAISVLEPLGPSPELASAYGNLAQLYMLRDEHEAAIEIGEKAIALARQIDDANALMYVLITVGTARFMSADFAGRALIEEALALALDRNRHADVTRSYCNLAYTAAEWYQWRHALDYLDAGLRYCDQWGIDTQLLCMISDRTQVTLYIGEWDAAADAAATLLRRPGAQSVQRVPALVTLARTRARRGDPGAHEPLADALQLSLSSDELQRMLPAAIGSAEIAWLENRSALAAPHVSETYALALQRGTPWSLGELAYWQWRAGDITDPPERCAEPYALQMRGDWRAAATAWDRIGCPYQRALALTESGEEQAVRSGLALLEQLGARAVVERVTRDLRARGVPRVPRGPRPTTRENPALLTRRQLDVLRLLGSGLTNDQIADRLFLSPRTVAHHVSAILLKLDARTRTEAIVNARSLGIPTKIGS